MIGTYIKAQSFYRIPIYLAHVQEGHDIGPRARFNMASVLDIKMQQRSVSETYGYLPRLTISRRLLFTNPLPYLLQSVRTWENTSHSKYIESCSALETKLRRSSCLLAEIFSTKLSWRKPIYGLS